jgi:uncharacterized protein YbjT (DUF2867 family)
MSTLAFPRTVLVTGATGRTGLLVFQKLQAQPQYFIVRGLGRSRKKQQQLLGDQSTCFLGDVRQPETLVEPLQGCNVLVILTSAMPVVVGQPEPGQRPPLGFLTGEMPEAVDYHGQVHQIEAARAAGVEHIILVGSMGGTNPDHMLNQIGNGNILRWKRKSEQYLIDSGIDYTIIRAGGLLDQPGGKRELLVGKDDHLLTEPPGGIPTSIPRADVAELVVQAILEPHARNKAFDVVSKPEADTTATVTTDFARLFSQTTPGL